MRFSDEVKDSDGETRTLQNSSESGSGSPTNLLNEKVGGERSDSEPPGPLSYGRGWGANIDEGEEGAPAPVVFRVSRDLPRDLPQVRESGRGW